VQAEIRKIVSSRVANAKVNKTSIEGLLRANWPILALLLAVGVVFGRTYTFGLTYCDDNYFLLDNQYILQDLANLPLIFKQGFFMTGTDVIYRPLVMLLFMLEAQLAGTDPAFYHLTNVLIHFLGSWMVFRFLLSMGTRRDLAGLLALIFAVHPALVSNTAWILGRIDALSTVFILASFIFFVKHTKKPSASPLILSGFFLFAGLLTKEHAAMLIPLFVLYWLLHADGKSHVKWRIAEIGLWTLVLAAWLFLRSQALSGSPFNLQLFMEKLLRPDLILVPLMYLGKSLIPFPLSVLAIVRDTPLVPGILSAVLVVGAFWLVPATNRKRYLFGFAWFILMIFPSVLVSNFLILEARLYTPLVGILLMMAQIRILAQADLTKKSWKVGFAGLILSLGVYSFVFSGHFRDHFSFWEQAVHSSPHSPLAQRNLGAMFLISGKYDASKPYFEEALRLNPAEPMANHNLGIIALDNGRPKEAKSLFEQELKVNPGYANSHFLLGNMLSQEGKSKEAVGHWYKALERNAGIFAAYDSIAWNFLRLGDTAQAAYFTGESLKRGGRPGKNLLDSIK
jgi:hypothetical protein